MIYRCILPQWAAAEDATRRRVYEGAFTPERIEQLNAECYNVYYLPNYPSQYTGATVEGAHVDRFEWVYVDMDLKDGTYPDKDAFVAAIGAAGIEPTSIVDSGNGVHVYWRVMDLDAMSFLRLNRRLCRKFKTDEAVAKIYQLMRLPGTVNTKHQDNFSLCEQIYASDAQYTCEDLDKLLPAISQEDEDYCQKHYDTTYKITKPTEVDEKIPLKFAQLIKSSKEAKAIWSGEVEDRSKADYRLGHLMFANGFTREEAMSVLVNASKALERGPSHRVSYAENIVDKIWTFEITEDKSTLNLSRTVAEILSRGGDTLKGTRFPCHPYVDNTAYGFRLGQVIGLVAGSGVGKTALALNMFRWFAQRNPDYDHFFIPLEQKPEEIADHWRTICGDDTALHNKVHILGNHDDDGTYRHLSFDDIKDYLLKFQKETGRKIGCVVIDHIGILKKEGRDGGRVDIESICHSMKAFAVQTNTLLIMQSQTSREKAGIGDLELDKDAAWGTVFFESYVDFLITLWQPLKRCYGEPACPTVSAIKFCKIRNKKKHRDVIQEDVPYRMFFDPETERLREMTQDEEKSFTFFLNKATNKRKQDRKTDLVSYVSVRPEGKQDAAG